MQKPLVPNSIKNLIQEDGGISRQFQLLLAALVQNTVPTTQSSSGAAMAGAILLPDAAQIPDGWAQIDTLTIGANTYKVITLV